MSRIPSTVPPEGAQIPARHPKAPMPGTKIPSHYGHCFGCGDLHPTGLHLVAHAGDGQNLTAVFTVTENHQGAPGLAHGWGDMAPWPGVCHWLSMKHLES